MYIADIEADIPPPRETSQKERQKFKNNHFVFLKNISYILESVKLRLFNEKESHSKSSPIVQSNCPVQLSSPVQSMFCVIFCSLKDSLCRKYWQNLYLFIKIFIFRLATRRLATRILYKLECDR